MSDSWQEQAKEAGWISKKQYLIYVDAAVELLEKSIARAVKLERERILNYLQDLIELSEKVKEPVIKIKMTSVLQTLKSGEVIEYKRYYRKIVHIGGGKYLAIGTFAPKNWVDVSIDVFHTDKSITIVMEHA